MKRIVLIFAITLPLFCACSTAKQNAAGQARLIVVPPVNPDIAPVRAPIAGAKEATARAMSSAARATVIVERIIPVPGQEESIAALKLELATTVDELRLTSEKLDLALSQIPQLEKEILNLMNRWKAENVRADMEADHASAERARADREHTKAIRAGRERDAFVMLFALSGVVAVLSAVKDPIRTIPNPWLQLLAWAAAAVGSFLACFWAIRVIVGFLVEITL